MPWLPEDFFKNWKDACNGFFVLSAVSRVDHEAALLTTRFMTTEQHTVANMDVLDSRRWILTRSSRMAWELCGRQRFLDACPRARFQPKPLVDAHTDDAQKKVPGAVKFLVHMPNDFEVMAVHHVYTLPFDTPSHHIDTATHEVRNASLMSVRLAGVTRHQSCTVGFGSCSMGGLPPTADGCRQ